MLRPKLMADRLGPKQARTALAFLQPHLAAAPVPVETTFDTLWWWNFSMKWQSVQHRMVAPMRDADRSALSGMVHHFFRTEAFQQWALTNPDKRIRDDWRSYKWPLKDYIFEFTDDKRYRERKTKERSLRGVFPHSAARPFAIDVEGRTLTQPYDPSLRSEDGNGVILYLGYGE